MMGWGWFGGIMMGIIWVGAIIVVVLLIRRLLTSSHFGDSKGEESALEILKKRYARGEINKDEFEEKRKDLG
jgi:putative membrane protein